VVTSLEELASREILLIVPSRSRCQQAVRAILHPDPARRDLSGAGEHWFEEAAPQEPTPSILQSSVVRIVWTVTRLGDVFRVTAVIRCYKG
jgi:hypothetical protein